MALPRLSQSLRAGTQLSKAFFSQAASPGAPESVALPHCLSVCLYRGYYDTVTSACIMYGPLPRAVTQALVKAQALTPSLQESGRDILLQSILGLPVHSVPQRLEPRVRYLETVCPEEG